VFGLPWKPAVFFTVTPSDFGLYLRLSSENFDLGLWIVYLQILHGTPPDLYLDFGGNTGVPVVFAARMGHKVITLEANPTTVVTLTNNVALNCVQENVTILNFGVGSDQDIIFVPAVHNKAGTGVSYTGEFSVVRGSSAGSPNDVKITIVRWDDVYTRYITRSPVLMKIDIEGKQCFLNLLLPMMNLQGLCRLRNCRTSRGKEVLPRTTTKVSNHISSALLEMLEAEQSTCRFILMELNRQLYDGPAALELLQILVQYGYDLHILGQYDSYLTTERPVRWWMDWRSRRLQVRDMHSFAYQTSSFSTSVCSPPGCDIIGVHVSVGSAQSLSFGADQWLTSYRV